MISMLKGAAFAVIIATSAAISSGAQAVQVFRDVGQVGQWKIQSGWENGKFLYCRAIGRASNGELALVQWADGKWRLSMSDFGLPAGRKFSGMMELRRGSIPFELVSNQPGLRESIQLNNALLDGLRLGGFIQLQVGGKTFSMQMENNAEAIKAVGDCRNTGVRGGLQPPAGGGVAGPGLPQQNAGRPGNSAYACTVYEQANYQGKSFGVAANGSTASSKNNNRISSVRVRPGCQMVAFTENNFRGPSRTITQDISQLSSTWDNAISSYRCVCR